MDCVFLFFYIKNSTCGWINELSINVSMAVLNVMVIQLVNRFHRF